MSLVSGLPTIIGGVNADQFISSIEQFDKSGNSWNIPLQRDWRIVNTALTLPRYEHSVATIPASQVKSWKRDFEQSNLERGRDNLATFIVLYILIYVGIRYSFIRVDVTLFIAKIEDKQN